VCPIRSKGGGETGRLRSSKSRSLPGAERYRRQCIDVLTRAKLQGELYNATSKIVEAIDGLAEVVTGDWRRSRQQSPRTPEPDLPPGMWRTVE
jgi:hypothetical protein